MLYIDRKHGARMISILLYVTIIKKHSFIMRPYHHANSLI